MSDTPRTDAVQDELINEDTYTLWLEMSQTARQLERELNAANQRIKSLIEERDTANRLADWKWNLRGEFESLLGTDNIEEGIKAVKEMKDHIKPSRFYLLKQLADKWALDSANLWGKADRQEKSYGNANSTYIELVAKSRTLDRCITTLRECIHQAEKEVSK